jgi:hypothetical protein
LKLSKATNADDDVEGDVDDNNLATLARRLKSGRNGKVPTETSVYDLSGRSPNFMQGTHPFARIMMMLDSAEYIHKVLKYDLLNVE